MTDFEYTECEKSRF